jgi:hypothetical protein
MSPGDPLSCAVAVRETHISVLVLIGDRVYKLKKPVSFDFVDRAVLRHGPTDSGATNRSPSSQGYGRIGGNASRSATDGDIRGSVANGVHDHDGATRCRVCR